MELETWLREKNMSTKEFAELVGCSRPVIWKVKRGIPICPKYGIIIEKLTKGEVIPDCKPIGRSYL